MSKVHNCPHCKCVITKADLRLKPGRSVGQAMPKLAIPGKATSGRAQMWTSMRVQLRFTVPSIAAVSNASVQNARVYINALLEAGYLRVVKTTTFEVGDYTTYLLLTNTGPHYPRLIGMHAIYDPNTKKEVNRVRDK